MNRKEILFICLVICCIFSLHAVAAVSDVNTTDDIGIASDDVSAYSLPDAADELPTGSEDAGTFKDLQDAVRNGGEVELSKNYTYVSSDSLENGISINQSTVIDGKGKVVIDASHQARVFDIAEGIAVTLKGITFINGNASGNGGSISSHGVLTIIDCKFINNTAAEHGGAIYLDHSTKSTIENCEFNGNVAGLNGGAIDWRYGSTHGKVISSTFTNNTAKRSGGAIHWSGHDGTIRDSNFTDNVATGDVISDIGGITGGGDGGAVLWVGSNGTVDNCRFIHNEANQRGGAIFLHGNITENCTNTTVSNSVFSDNIAGLNGGAVDWQEGAHDGNIYNTTFTHNTAGSNGGAVFWAGHYGEVHNSNFTNNTAKGTITDTHGNIGDGGAIIWSGVNGAVTNCMFINNSANQRGGAVYLQNSTHDNCTNTTFSWCTFINNTAGVNGGALDWHDGADDGNVYNSTFTHNTAGSNGGAIFWAGHNGRILDSNFTSNTARGLAIDVHGNIGDGGAIIWSGINGTVDNCRFISNEAMKNSAYDFGGRGGAVYLQNCSHGNCTNTTFTNSYFYHNVAGTNGGALDWHDGAHDGLVENGTFINNTAKRSGGAIFWDGHNGTVRYSKFYDNHALGNVSAISVLGDITTGGDGGAIMWSGALGDVEYCNFVNNTAAKRGGAVFLQASEEENATDTEFRHSHFRNNTAGTNGGAIDWNKGAHNGIVDNVTFINNTAMRSGGAIFWNGHNGTVRYSRFYDNRALGEVNATSVLGDNTTGGDGGAVMWSGALGDVEYCNFVNNTAAKRGGAVFLQASEEENATDTEFRHSYFRNNTAGTNGGAIDWNKGAHNGIVDNVTFINNTAKRSGGAIYWFGTQGVVNNSRFIDNHALGNASAINSFGENTTGGHGGAIMWTGANGTVENSTFDRNDAKVNGGAMFLQGSSEYGNCENIAITDSKFTNNFAGVNGGAIDWYRGALNGTVANCDFDNNTANRSGGAIFWFGRNGTITDSSFTNNRALGQVLYNDSYGNPTYGGNGGAIMWTGYHGTVKNCTFETNFAEINGGAVYLQGSDMGLCTDTLFDNCTYIDNTAGLDGGAINWYVGARNGTVSNSNFINNTAKHSGGAISWNGMGGNIGYSNFTGNKALGTTAIDTDHINFTSLSQVHEVTHLPATDSSTYNQLYVLVTYQGTTKVKYELYVTVPDPVTEYRWSKLLETYSTDPSPTDWATDEYFGGNGGSIIWEGDSGIVDHCIFIESDSARRGGGAYMKGSDNITFSNCYFENSTSGTNGGGLDWLAGANYGKVINSTFNNTRAARSAGAIYYDGDYGEITNVTIINATAFGGALKESRGGKVQYAGWDSSHWDTNTTGGDAGAIMFTGDNIYVYNATFTNCTAAGRGGAVFLQDNKNVTFELCVFEENSALGTANNTWKNYKEERNDANANTEVDYRLTGHGGAIAFDVGASDGYIIDSIFNDNHAHRDGGAIYYAAGATRGIVINSTFINHTINYDGGAIYLNGTYCEIHNSTFLNNSAKDDGGAIFWQGDHGLIHNITCDLNHGLGTGAGGGSSTKGGVICLTGSDVVVERSTFTNSYGGLLGGTIFVTGNNVNITDSVFKNSTIGISEGGALYILGDDTLIRNCTFDNCTSPSEGGTIYVLGDRVVLEDSTITNSTAINGGAIYIEGQGATISNTQISNVNASVYGGAIYVEGDNADISVNITDSSVSGMDNYVPHIDSDYYAGHIADLLNRTDEMIVFVDGITCVHISQEDIARLKSLLNNIRKAIENVSTADGRINSTNVTVALGLLDELNETLTGINATLSVAEYKENTQALFKYAADAEKELVSLAVIDASLEIPDGILENINSMIANLDTLESQGVPIETILDLNNALQSIKDDAENIFLGNKFNFAAINLTSVLLDELNQTLTRINATLSGNALDELFKGIEDTKNELNNLTDILKKYVVIPKAYGSGGAIYISGDGDVISNSHISQASAYYGGAIYISGDDATIESSDFKDINATEDGGVLYISGDGGKLYNSNFTHNFAGDDGGAIYWSGDHGTIENIICSDNHGTSFNKSSSRGGAICLTGDDVTISKSKFTYNNVSYAEGANLEKIDGGALFITGNDVTISETEFSHNNASHYGGTLYVLGNETVIDNCTIDHSNATRGGAIYVEGENATISAAFKNTNATLSGGAIYVHGENARIVDSTFDTTYAFGSVDNGGGAIMVNGNFTSIENSNFTNTHADNNHEARGGAIYIKGIATNITGSKFEHSRSNRYGGSIYINGTNTTIMGSNFTDCTVSSDGSQGGAIYVNGEYTTIIDSAFDQNTAKGEGGAIYIHGLNTTISNSTFEENSVYGNGGGAIYVNGDYATIEGSNFTKNEANVKDGAEGGAIYVNGIYTLIEGSNFADSSAKFRGGAIYIDGKNAKVKDSNFTNSSVTGGAYGGVVPQGGAIYIKAEFAVVEGSIFNCSSVPETSAIKGEGGAIFIEGNDAKILGSEFDSSRAYNGGAIYLSGAKRCNVSDSSFSNSHASYSGGAMYSTGSDSIAYNSNFTNNLAEMSGGALYWEGGSSSIRNTVDGCIFTNNTAHGNTTSKDATRGGGAIYWSENGRYGTVKNSKFYYNSVQSTIDKKVDGGAILWDKSYHALVDNCIFVGNFVTTNGDVNDQTGSGVWAQGGAMYLRPNANYTVRNCHFENCSSSKEAGALYIQGKISGSDKMVLLENSVFINNVAYANGKYNINGGGAIQIKQCTNSEFKNLTFINNTANKGGALCVFDSVSNLVVDGANFTGNKAVKGSAISASRGFTLKNAVLLENRANTTKFDLTFNRDVGSIDILLEGGDTHFNALYMVVDKSENLFNVNFDNVTYWTDNNISIGKEEVITGSRSSTINVKSVPEAGISITVELFDRNNNKLNVGNDIFATDANGELHLTPDDFTGVTSFENVYVVARLTNEDYYTQVVNTTRLPTEMQATAHNVTYHRNATVNVTMAPSSESEGNASGNVSVYYNDTFLGNITLADNNTGISNEISTLLGDHYLEVGTHNLTLRYWGDLYNDAVNLTVPINVTKAQSNITIIYEDMGYDLFVNVTIVDDYDDVYYKDATGNVIIEVYSKVSADPLKTAIVNLINGTGLVRIENLLPSNYTIKARYGGDHNYYPSVNSTPAEVREKADAIVDIQVSAYDIMVNETVYINITLITPDGYNATGNVTLYLNNEKYVLPLNNSKAYFNTTGLPEGRKIITVCYDGNEQLIPTSNDATFWVHKYNTTIAVNTTNITHIQHEVINITLLNDTVGVVSVFINDEEYFARINNGTAILELPLLPVGEYNVTVVFPGDDKYNNNTTYAKFNVLPATPEIIIDVENVTYGESTPVVVKLINCAEGNVSIEIDGTPYADSLPVNNGRVEFVINDLAAGNYTLKATYSGDANHTAASAEQDFTVYKADRTVIVDVQNIVYGDDENINVHVNATGNVTVKINGKTIEDYKVLEDNSTQITLANWAAGIYNVEVIYNGNENYTKARETATFIISPMDTSLDVNVHELLVWEKEYINITVRDSTGDVATNLNGTLTININGVDHHAEIINGTARFNITENSVGSRVVWVFYEGDGNFTQSKVMKTYDVFQRTPSMEVIAHDITVGQDGNITVNLPANATGYVQIEVDGVGTYYSSVSHGQAFAYPKNLKEGYYKVIVRYYGDAHDNYKHVSHIDYFTVSKAEVNLTIDVNDTVYGNDSNIVVYVDNGVEGSITVKINDTLIGTYGIVDGKVNITVRLPAGNYTVHAEYGGSYGYDAKSTSNDFNVAKATPVITIDAPDAVDANTNATIVVRINDTATGNITITVNGTKYNATIKNGVAVFVIDKLLSGKYDITAEYAGDNNYTAAATVTLTEGLTVDKVSCYQINVTANDTKVGWNSTITVRVPADAVGNVSIYVDGKLVENVTISQGIAQLNVTRPYGNHTVNVTFTDGKYGFRYAIADFWVFKHESPLVIDADSILVGDIAYINVTAPSDNVTIEINGETYTRVRYENGIAYFEVSGLEHGNKTVVAIYGGNDTYVENTTTRNFTVSKRDSYINLNVTNSTVGSGAFINVTVPDDAKGYVIVTVNNINYTINLAGGKGNVTIFGLENSTYDVNVTYIGDEKYLPSTNSTKLGIDKLTTTFDVNGTDITVGEGELITIETPDDITGLVTVEINDKNYTAFIYQGKGNLTVYELSNGTYNVTVYFEGNDMYLPASDKDNFTVSKARTNITVRVDNITLGEVAVVNITVTGASEGNVTITIGDEFNKTVGVTNGVISVIVPGLTVGDKTVNVTYNENGKYAASSNSTTFVVSKANLTSDIKLIDNGNGTVTVILPQNATGNVTIYVDGKNFTGNVSDGMAVITLENVTPGTHNITAVYSGDGNFTNATVNGTVTVPKLVPSIRVDVADIYVGDVALINVTLPSNATGTVTIEINGVIYTPHSFTGGIARFTVENLPFGVKTVAVVYSGDNNYTGISTTANFTVYKRNSQVNLTVNATTVGKDVIINVTIPSNANGYVIVIVDGQNYSINTTGGIGSVRIPGLGNTTHNVNVTYLGDDQYLPSSNGTNFTVNKVPSTVSVKGENITLGDVEVITVTVPVDATGNVTVRVVGVGNYTVPIANGTGSLVVRNLAVGTYTVNVEYNGDGKYMTNNNHTQFTVSRVNTTAEDITVIDKGNGTVVVVVPGNATGNVTITVGNHTYVANVTNGTAVIDLVNETPGEHNITVFYSGDGNFTNVTVNSTVVMPRIVPTIDVNVTNIYVGDVALINVTLPVDATGTVTIEINGVVYTPASFTGGIARFEVGNLPFGVKTVAVTYGGDHNYTDISTTANFTVFKRNSQVNLTVNATTVGNDVIINVTIPSDAVGYVIVIVDGQNYSINTTGGIGSVTISGLGNTTHNVNVTYLGDEKYLPSSNGTNFTVDKVDSTVSVVGENITLGDAEVITITVPVDATGNVTVNVVGVGNYTVPVANGKGILVVKNLAVGTYTVNVNYNGDGKYLPNNNYTTFTVSRVNTTAEDITVIDKGNGTVVVVVPNNATGNVTITVGNHTYVANVTNGTAVIDLVNETPGTHNITVIYSGDGNFTNVTVNSTVVMPRIVPTIDVNVTNIYVGDVALINVTLPVDATGTVTIEINGVVYTPASFTGGIARFEVGNLPFGVKTVAVTYSGDHNYTDISTTANFTVFKRNSQVNLTVNATTVGNDVIINVTIPSDAVGYVIVIVDGQNYSINTTGGIGSVTISGLENITHNVNVTYLGDEKYLPSSNGTNFTVDKVDSTVSVVGENITLGDREVITITVPVDATGNVTVNVVGVGNYTVSVANGTGILVIKNLPVGTYTVNVNYNGDGKYLPNNNHTTFTVSRVNMTADDIKVIDQGNGTVVVVVPGNATGNVTITVGNHTYVANVTNGTAVIDLVNETPGEHNITVFYSGDGNFTNATVNSTISISKMVPTIKVNVTDIHVGDVALINVTLPADATGTVTIEINGISYTPYEFKDGIARFKVENLTYGVKTVAVTYGGDHNYTDISTTANFTVYKRNSQVNLTVNATTVGNDIIINVTIPSDAVGYVIVIVDGQNYSINTTGGIGSVTISGLGNTTHNVNVTYLGDEKYLPSSNGTSFTVNKVDSTVSVVGENITLGDREVITITVPVDATGNVTVNVVGVGNYTVSVANGTGILVVKGLAVGTYTVNVNYNGDGKYLPNNNHTTFTVSRVNTTADDIKVIDQGNGTVVVIVPENATGNVTITVGNHTYVANVTNGTATIDLVNETPGTHNITVIYSGDGNYTGASVNSTVTIPKLSASIDVNATDIYVGDVALINVTLPGDATGNVTIEINGIAYTPYEFTDGIARFRVENLTAGVKTVAVTYSGDHNYTANFTTANFTVYKRQSFVNVSVSDIDAGKVATINVTIPENATGIVIVSVGETNYTINMTTNTGSITVRCLESGDYNVTVTYMGDDQYLSSINDTENFTVSKLQPEFTVNGTEITYGEPEFITIQSDSNITGRVTVEVDGQNYTTFINDGRGNLTIEGLKAGKHNITVYFEGNRRYLNATANNTFTVNKAKASIVVVPQNITFGDKEIITIYVNATGIVNITVDDVTYSNKEIVDGKVELKLLGYLYAGNYTAYVAYNGNENYTVTYAHADFTVAKRDPSIRIVVQNITYGDVEHIIVYVNASGNVTIRVNGTEENLILNESDTSIVILRMTVDDLPKFDGRAHEYLYNLNVGAYPVEVIYHGNENYNEATASALFTVGIANTTIALDVGDISANGRQTINVTLGNPNATGDVIINVDGVNYTRPIVNGTATLVLDNVASGNHSVVAIYEGNDNVRGNWTSARFAATKVKPDINIIVNDTTVGAKEKITVELPDGATGYVVIDVDGTKYHVDIPNGASNVTIEVDNLKNKTYTVTAQYSGDGHYEGANDTASFNVSKVKAEISVEVDNITYGDAVVINITTPEDMVGNVTVSVGGENYTVYVAGGHGTLVVPGLNVGDYPVDATFNGSDKYEPASNSTEFTVSRINTAPEDIKVIDQGNGTVVVVVPNNATGNVTIKVGNNTYIANVTNGTATIDLINETPGTHDITVIYSGDGNFTNATVNATVTMPRIAPTIDVETGDIYVGDAALINVTLPGDATGDVTIEIDGVTYTPYEFENGVARFRVENLTAGTKTVAVTYSGDHNYTAVSTTDNFTVSKRQSDVNVTVNATTVGNDVIVNVTIPANATGYVVVVVDGQNYSINTTGGVGSVTIPGLGNTTHNVNVTYLGDDQYLPSSSGTTFTLDKVDSTVSAVGENITLGDAEVITITVPDDATGNVTVEIVGVGKYTVPVANGTGILVAKDLPVGTYDVKLDYNGDGKYLPSKGNATFTVSRVNTTPDDIKVIDQGNGTVVVVVPGNATGNVTVKIGDHEYVANVTNGTAVINIDNETPGTHDIEVIYSGDGNFNNTSVNATVTIPKYVTPINVNADNIHVGDSALIDIILPENATGDVTIEIDGVTYTPYEFKDGIARFSVENLTAGTKTVAVRYSGDDNYVDNFTTANFTVSKRQSDINVTVNATTVGNDVIINVTIPSNATGYVVVVVDGQNYSINTTGGVGSVTIPGLGNTTHNVNVTYIGDDQYLPSSNGTTFTLDKVDSTVSAVGENITLGDTEMITINVPTDATGNVTVEIVGVGTYTVPVANGTGILVVKDLPVGTYDVKLDYNGDGKYLPSKGNATFTVSRVNTNPDDIKVIDQGNGTVVVVVPNNATGNVTVKIGDHEYVANITNGTAIINIDNETPGTHDIEVIYSGDGNFNNTSVNATVMVPKYVTPINVDVDNIHVGDPALIEVILPDNATGNVTIEIDGVTYTTDELKDGIARFSVENLTAGTKTVVVRYSGDDNYVSNFTTSNFTVSKCNSTVSATITDTEVGENVTVTVTVPKDATGHVLIDIGGVGYYVNVTNGTGSVEIPRIPSGVYPANITYVGDDKYLPSYNNASFNVNKVPSFVIPTAHDIPVGANEFITIQVPEDATGNVTLIIDGEEYIFNLNDGTLGAPYSGANKYSVAVSGGNGAITVTGLPKGEYVVSVKYNGDDKYLQSSNTTKFIVYRQSTDMEVIDKGNGTVVVVLPDDATGNVTVTIDNQTYVVNVTNGTAVIDLVNATPGTHNVTVTYSGDDTYGRETVNSTVSIPKRTTPISVDVSDIYVGDTETVIVHLPDDATGRVEIEINGKKYYGEAKNGKAVIKVSGLAYGPKTVAVTYYGDDYYVENFTTAQFKVSKRPSSVSASAKNIRYGNDGVITITVPSDQTGRVLVNINGIGYYATIKNGKAKVVVPGLDAGNYKATVTYEGDDKYLSSTTSASFKVTKKTSSVSATGDEIYEGEDADVVVDVPKDASGSVTITVDGKKYTTNVKNGKATFKVPGLSEGTYRVDVRYSGDKNHDPETSVTTIIVHKHVEDSDDGEGVEHHESSALSKHATGNPILVLLLIILALGSTQIRRFKK